MLALKQFSEIKVAIEKVTKTSAHIMCQNPARCVYMDMDGCLGAWRAMHLEQQQVQ